MSPAQRYLKDLLEEDRIKEVIEGLIALGEHNASLNHRETDYYMLASQLAGYERKSLAGTTRESDLTLTFNRIRRSATHYVFDLKSDVTLPPELAKKVNAKPSPPVGPDANTTDTNPTKDSEDIVKILMLTANPTGTVRLNLNREHAQIHTELSKSPQSRSYDLKPKADVRITELNQEIVLESPQIVHFSGHGRSSAAAPPDPNDPFAEAQPGELGGLMLEDPTGKGYTIATADWLAFVFKSMIKFQGIPLKLVLLNACHSGEQAAAIAKHVEFVIGTTDEVLDEAAWVFSKGFYFRLASFPSNDITEEVVRMAFNIGQMNAVAMGEPIDRFSLYIRGELVAD